MTDLVNPSYNRDADSFLLSGTINGVSGLEDYVVPATDSPTRLAQAESVDEQNLNAFAESSTNSSFNVTIDGGEAFVYGTWVLRDTQTTVSLDSNTTGQVVYVGWQRQSPNSAIIGLESAFTADDPKMELYSFDTDSTGVIK